MNQKELANNVEASAEMNAEFIRWVVYMEALQTNRRIG